MASLSLLCARVCSGMSESAPPRIVPYLKMLAPLVSFCIVLSQILIPVFYHAAQLVYAAWCLLPLDIMYIVTGLVICFFGGMVRAAFAIKNKVALKDNYVTVHSLKNIYFTCFGDFFFVCSLRACDGGAVPDDHGGARGVAAVRR